MRRDQLRFIAATAALAMVAGSALAQGQPARERPMRGPAVEQNRPEQVEGRFSEPMMGRPGQPGQPGGMGQRPVPHNEFMSVVWMLRDPEAPRGLRMAIEQEERISEIDRKHQEAVRKYQEELRELVRAERPERPARPQEGDADQGEERPQVRRLTEAERDRLEQMRANMPRPADAQTRIFAELTDMQRAFVQEELDERRRIAERDMMRRRMEAQRGEQPPGREGPGAGRMGQFGGPEMAAQRERLGRVMQNLQRIPQAEREQLLARLDAELERLVIQHGGTPAAAGESPWGAWQARQGERPMMLERRRPGGEGGDRPVEGERRRRFQQQQQPQEPPR